MPQRLPDHLPASVLERPDFITACAQRDLGAIFRLARKWAGFTNSHLCRRCELSLSRVADYADRGMQAQSVALFERAADGLHIPGSMLGLERRFWEQEAKAPSPLPGNSAFGGLMRAEAVARPEEEDPMRRRTLLASIAGLTTAVAGLNSDTGSRVERVLDGGQVDASTIAELRTVAASYRRAYRSLPAGSLLPLAHGQINLVMSLRPGNQFGQRRTDLLTHLGEMAALAAVLNFLDLSNQPAGDAYLNLAHQAARATESPELLALVFAARAFSLAYAGDQDAGLDCALAAMRYASSGASARMRAWVAAVASEMHAARGDRASCFAALDTSRQALSGELDDSAWSGIGAFDLSKVSAYEGGDLVRLGAYHQALPILDAALAQLDASMTRHRCTAHIDRADALAAAGETEAACHDADTALVLLEQTHHRQSLNRLTSLYRTVRTANIPATWALSERLIDVRSIVATGSFV
jgi:hypothetical protein